MKSSSCHHNSQQSEMLKKLEYSKLVPEAIGSEEEIKVN